MNDDDMTAEIRRLEGRLIGMENALSESRESENENHRIIAGLAGEVGVAVVLLALCEPHIKFTKGYVIDYGGNTMRKAEGPFLREQVQSFVSRNRVPEPKV